LLSMSRWTGGYPPRLGFIKLAIREGYVLHHLGHRLMVDVTIRSADLVPVFSFGENDVRSLSYTAFHLCLMR
jgi:hypothetical protein